MPGARAGFSGGVYPGRYGSSVICFWWYYFGIFEEVFLRALPNRLFGIINNETLIAVPLFVFMGSMLERAKVAEEMLSSMAAFGGIRGGLAYSVILRVCYWQQVRA